MISGDTKECLLTGNFFQIKGNRIVCFISNINEKS